MWQLVSGCKLIVGLGPGRTQRSFGSCVRPKHEVGPEEPNPTMLGLATKTRPNCGEAGPKAIGSCCINQIQNYWVLLSTRPNSECHPGCMPVGSSYTAILNILGYGCAAKPSTFGGCWVLLVQDQIVTE